MRDQGDMVGVFSSLLIYSKGLHQPYCLVISESIC